MKTIKIFTFLILLSLQAGATGYAHNMFVAHKKLQAGKESTQPSEKMVARKARPAKMVKVPVAPKPVAAYKAELPAAPEAMTLNQRILEAGPAAFFKSESADSSDDSIVTKLIAMVRCAVYAFIGLPG